MAKFSPKEYDAWHETPLGSLCDKLEKEEIFTLFHPKGLVLDVGCGTGNYTLELTRREATVVGIDSSFDMILSAKRKAKEQGLKAHFVAGKGEALPFKSGVFDGAFSITTLCFASNAAMMVDEIKRVVRLEGEVVLGELNKLSYWALLRRIKALFKESSYRGARFFSLKGLKRFLEEKGFGDLKWSSCLYFPPIDSQWFLKCCKFFEGAGKVLFPKNGAFIVIGGKK